MEGTCSQNADETKFGLKITDPTGTVSDETVFPIDYDVRLNAKTTIKKELYGMLKKRTGKELPWGTLTGIRPTKIAMTRLDQGEDEESIRSFMRDMYLTSEEKIDLSVEVAKRERELLSHIDYETDTASMWNSVLSDHLPLLFLHLLPDRRVGEEGSSLS